MEVHAEGKEANAEGQVLCQTCGTSCGGKPVHWVAEQEAIVCSDCYGKGDSGGDSDNDMDANTEGKEGGQEDDAGEEEAPAVSNVTLLPDHMLGEIIERTHGHDLLALLFSCKTFKRVLAGSTRRAR